jgi:2-haloacid dehalogenase
MSTDRDLTKYKALSFDCYGTLIDWEAGIAAVLAPWAREQGLGLSDEDLLLAYADNEAAVEREIPSALYPDVLAVAFRRTGEKLGTSVSDAWAGRLADSVPDWPAFPDSADALARLARYYKLIILSNVHRAGFAASNERLRGDFVAVITAEDVGAYKPAENHFRALHAALPGLGVDHDGPAARRAEPVPRPRPGQAGRVAVRLDKPPPRPPRLGSNAGTHRRVGLRPGVHVDGRLRRRSRPSIHRRPPKASDDLS